MRSLQENKIDPDDFFAENYLTDGMKRLLENAFLRFERKSQQGLYRLTQAMGGGKTHTMPARQAPQCLFPEIRT